MFPNGDRGLVTDQSETIMLMDLLQFGICRNETCSHTSALEFRAGVVRGVKRLAFPAEGMDDVG